MYFKCLEVRAMKLQKTHKTKNNNVYLSVI